MQKFKVTYEGTHICAEGTIVVRLKSNLDDNTSLQYVTEDSTNFWFFKANEVEPISEEQSIGLSDGITDLQLCALWHCLYVSRKVLKESTKHLQFSEESFTKLYNEADLMWDRIDELCTAKGIDPMKLTVTKATEIK